MFVMAKDRPEGLASPDAVPAYGSYPPGMMLKLVAAWAAMGFRRPEVAW